MKFDVEKLKAIGVKHGIEICEEVSLELLFPALEQAVKESATPVDDMVLAALEVPLKAAFMAMLAKLKV
jgi:hypothetical protein